MPAFLRRVVPMVILLVAFPLEAAAKPSDRVYTDTKQRFALELPSGWRLHPMPGDSTGMTFRRDVDGAFALLRVSVRQARRDDDVARALEAATGPFRGEIGFRAGAEVPTSMGLLPARRRSLTVHASGDERTVRAVELVVMVAFGHVHVLHFECLDKERARFARDLDRLIGSYRALAGRGVYAPLIGTWTSASGGPELILGEDDRFRLGPLAGTFSTDGGQLSLHVPQGTETYRYRLEGARLVLTSPNLEVPSEYRRSGSARFSSGAARPQHRGPLRSEDLIGRWRVLDGAGTEPLVLQLATSGAVSFGPLSGRWRFRRGRLTIESTVGSTVTYHASLDGDRLVLGGGDLEKEIHLVRDDPGSR